ncbi:MAG: hypothetical protein MK133_10840, partial [Planctomycetes bacterium]|nr:hypothetical protein [Planctomycetota bacterium]
ARETPRPQPTLERPAMEAPAIERPETEVLPFSETVLQREAIQAESSEALPEDLAFPEERSESLTPEILKRQLERPQELAQEDEELVSDLRVREVSQARVELPEIELPEREPVEAPQLKELERTDTQAPVLQASKLETENVEAPDVSPNEKQATQSEVELAARQLTPEERAKAEDSRIEVAREVSRSTPQENKPVERAETAVELARADPSEAQPETTQRRELSPVEQVDSPPVEKQAPTVENAPERAVVNSEQPSVEAKTLQRPEPAAESARENLAIKSAQPVSRASESAEASIERPEVEFNASPPAPPGEGTESKQRPAVATVGKAVAAVDSPQANPEAPGAASKVAAESDAPDVSRKQLEAPAQAGPETGTPALKVARQATRAASEISRTVAREIVELEVQKAKPVSGAADSSNEAKLPDVGRAEAPRTVEKDVVAKEAPQRSESAGVEPTIAKRASV